MKMITAAGGEIRRELRTVQLSWRERRTMRRAWRNRDEIYDMVNRVLRQHLSSISTDAPLAAIPANQPPARAVVKYVQTTFDWKDNLLFNLMVNTLVGARTVPPTPYRLLHFFLPRRHREVILRELEEQFRQEAADPLLGPQRAEFYYWQRTIEEIAWLAKDRSLQELRFARKWILAATALVLAAVALVAALHKLGAL